MPGAANEDHSAYAFSGAQEPNYSPSTSNERASSASLPLFGRMSLTSPSRADADTTTSLRSTSGGDFSASGGAGIWQSMSMQTQASINARPYLPLETASVLASASAESTTGAANSSDAAAAVAAAVTQELKAMNAHLVQQTQMMAQQQQTQNGLWEIQATQLKQQRRDQKMQRLRWATEDVWSQTFLETFTCLGFNMEFHHQLLVDLLRAFRMQNGSDDSYPRGNNHMNNQDLGAPIPGRIYLYPSRNAEGIPIGAQGNEMIREGLCRAMQYLTGVPPRIRQDASGLYVMHYE